MTHELLESAETKLVAAAALMSRRLAYYDGRQPSAFIAADAEASLNASLKHLAVNYPRLVVSALGERLDLLGAESHIDADAARAVWALFCAAGGEDLATRVHTDRLSVGVAYVMVWADAAGRLALTSDTPDRMTVYRDPATDEITHAVRMWTHPDTQDRHATILRPDRIERWRSAATRGAWDRDADDIDNPFDAVPVVPFARRMASTDPEIGTPAAQDIYTLTDALNKLAGDILTTSEFYARPRRWATGLEIDEEPVLDAEGEPVLDDDGEPVMRAVDPFGSSRFLQSEDPETKFGQLPSADMSGYASTVQTITQQIGALTGLPPNYIGLAGDQPSSAEATNAAENQLVQRADTEIRALTRPWATVLAFIDAHRRESAVADALADLRPLWGDTQSRTPAQEADAAAKLHGIGVPLPELLRRPLRYTDTDAARIAALAQLDRREDTDQ